MEQRWGSLLKELWRPLHSINNASFIVFYGVEKSWDRNAVMSIFVILNQASQ